MTVTEVRWWVVGGGRKDGISGRRTEARERGIFRKPESGWGCGTGDWKTEMAEGWGNGGRTEGKLTLERPPGMRTPGS